ncbi:hypothetical protein C5748_13070 [Phyllobacterium phragmitis]|uniref:DUF4402 domain-containing protein n=2 Tax=Phyllobacterium phragmitis TaxID=2670329 RepID=A0A2S9IRH8_9HYPH|nr:hypothetical protein C5748_13070 [Phyllobacterium phragmitis]
MMALQHRYPLALAIAASLLSGPVLAQSAIEHHVWQDKRKFEPYSRTAESITGAIRLSGNNQFATPGSKMTITFGNGKKAQLTSVGASWRQWDDVDGKKVTAEVFKVAKDPGTLLNGNTLCGKAAKYLVFHESLSFGASLLGVAVFEGSKEPKDINSPGLCGTFNYSVD